ncbi:MAG: AraC family transcriptional regulator [Cytophagales bacterium]
MKYIKFYLALLPILLGIVCFFFIHTSPLVISPGTLKSVNVKTYATADQDVGGDSRSHLDIRNSNFILNYILGDKKEFPYSSIAIEPVNQEYIDLSEYDDVEIKMKSKSGKRVPFYISTYIEGYSKPEEFNSYLNRTQLILIKSTFDVYKFSIHEMQTPSWWYTVNKLTEDKNILFNTSKVKFLTLSNCSILGRNINDEIEVEYISFKKNYNKAISWFVILSIVYYTLFYAYIKFVRTNKHMFYKENIATEVSEEEVDLLKIKTCILENFQDSELSLAKLQVLLGFHERKIANVIKNQTSFNFKQYLNQIRTEKAKELLLENKLNISEIAFETGYSNVTHFNRVFKSVVGQSPTEFKENVTIC